jgi:NYN domain/OST-HTH/LOTUS domain
VPEPSLAVLVDFENVARPGAKSRGDFDIQLVLSRLAEKGRVLVKRSYADWSRYRDARHDLQNAGLELIELPSAREGAKNRADIKLAVDAMELAYSREHLDYFVIVSGDSDFTPLVGKLRELNKRVIGIAHKESASDLLIANCDEFIFYETIAKTGGQTSGRGRGSRDLDPVELVRETLEALQREGTEWPLASVVKDSMRRKFPAFDESDHGHGTFSKFLEAMRDHGIVRLETDPRSGTYRVELTESRQPTRRREPAAAAPASAPGPSEDRPGGENGEPARRRRRRRRGSGGGEGGEAAAVESIGKATTDDAVEVDDGMEVFEIRVTPTPDKDVGTLPPLDQPISYEDMLMLSPEIAAELPPVPDGDAAEQDGPPAREARRRRRRVSLEEDEVTLVTDEDDEDADAEAEAPAEEEAKPKRRVRSKATAEAPKAAVETPAEDEAKPKRRVRSKAAAATAEAPEAAVEAPAEEEAKPKRRVRSKAAAATAEAPEAVAEAPAEEETKPKRRVRSKAATATVEAPEAVVEAPAEDAPAEEASTSRRRVRRKSTATADETPASADADGIGPGKSPY